jgi:pyruvate formate lyase activating enzyme
MVDTAVLARKRGLKNVWVTCGYINPEPLRELCKVLDGANVDLKGFTKAFYRKYSFAKLDPVLQTLKILKEEGVWFEITNLVIPGANDDPGDIRKMCKWIRRELGEKVPVHFSRFFPQYKLTHLSPTPLETLRMAYKIAREEGLKYVYTGNCRGIEGENTYCGECGKLLIKRNVYYISEMALKKGKCPHCGEAIPGVWE